MKTKISFILLFAVAVIAIAFNKTSFQNGKESWTEKQLMNPAELAKILNDKASKKPILLSIGFKGGIKNSIEVGAANDKAGIENLKKELAKYNKDANIVIYCGCCPFANCPNIRPAFNLLGEMKFTNHKLLNLPHNLKADWIDKGYPMNQ